MVLVVARRRHLVAFVTDPISRSRCPVPLVTDPVPPVGHLVTFISETIVLPLGPPPTSLFPLAIRLVAVPT
jgi:hypothetical protein